jgi:formate--tetrahydrofolate ligase
MAGILEVAQKLGLRPDEVTPWGEQRAKVGAHLVGRSVPTGHLVLVSAMTPTLAGEGKTTVAIGLADALARLGARACLALREPSIGPTLGLKGGGTGGGRAHLVPAEDINLHFTGDSHAVAAAHNLLAAALDNHLHRGNALKIDVGRVFWDRVVDMDDRALRHIIIGLGGPLDGVPRQSRFDITAASEVMAVLCLAEDLEDLRRRLARIVVALDRDGGPVTASQLNVVGAMLVLLKDAFRPNVVQTRESTPALVHGGPFGNIAHGCSSVVATKLALGLADWVVTEAGFGFDLGGEKFFDLVCRSAKLDAAAVVVVATIRALRWHGGAGRAAVADVEAVDRGLANLHKQIENVRAFHKDPIVALNSFPSDTAGEIAMVRRVCEDLGVPLVITDVFARGGEGGLALAQAVLDHMTGAGRPFAPLYDCSQSITGKMETIAQTMYGARGVAWEPQAERDLSLIRSCGGDSLPLCVAKTPSSLSDDPKAIGRPANFDVTVTSAALAAGAGYVVPILGNMQRMPGLPASPQAERMDLVDGRIAGMT